MDSSKNEEENELNYYDEEISDSELENSISTLQNAINIVKSQRKQTEQETQIIPLVKANKNFIIKTYIIRNKSLFIF